jgi:hypothetical protein
MQQKEDIKTAESGDTSEIHKARQGLLKALQRNLAPKFSSTPIAIRKTSGGEPDTGNGAAVTIATDTTLPTQETAAAVIDTMENKSSPLIAGNHSVLTESEKLYLEALLQSNDPALLLTASQTLNDATLFPPPVDPVRKGGDDDNGQSLSLSEEQQPQENDEAAEGSGKLAAPLPLPEVGISTNPRTAMKHRDSDLQQQLFRLHEMTNSSAKPSQVLQRMSLMSQRNNSILASEEDVVGGLGTGAGGAGSEKLAAAVAETLASGAWDMEQDQSEEAKELEDFGVGDWNPFKDISCKCNQCSHLLPLSSVYRRNGAPSTLLHTLYIQIHSLTLFILVVAQQPGWMVVKVSKLATMASPHPRKHYEPKLARLKFSEPLPTISRVTRTCSHHPPWKV